MNIGAAFEGAATAVDDQIGRSRKRSGPLFNVCQALLGGSAAVACRARDMTACKERAKTHVHDCRELVSVCRHKFADWIRRLHQFRAWQGRAICQLAGEALHPRRYTPASYDPAERA